MGVLLGQFLDPAEEDRITELLGTRGDSDPEGEWCLVWRAPEGFRAPDTIDARYRTELQAVCALALVRIWFPVASENYEVVRG